jgi:hypothetical protein
MVQPSSLTIHEQCKSVACCDLEQNTLSSAARMCMDILVVSCYPYLAGQLLNSLHLRQFPAWNSVIMICLEVDWAPYIFLIIFLATFSVLWLQL